MNIRRTALSVVTAIGLIVVVAACAESTAATDDHGGHGGDHTATEQINDPVAGAAEISVSAIDVDFKPAVIEVKAGEPTNVTIRNDGQALHDFTVEAADVHVNVAPGETKTTSLTVPRPGTYEARCTVPGHADAGMTIEVVAL